MSPSRRGRSLAEPVLVLRGVSKTYRAGIPGCLAVARALVRIDLVLLAGERVAVVGPTGAGKTTLLLIAAGVLRCDAGEVWSIGAAPLARWGDMPPRPSSRGVAEPAARRVAGWDDDVPEAVSWFAPERTWLFAARAVADVALRPDRVLRLEAGRLHAADRPR